MSDPVSVGLAAAVASIGQQASITQGEESSECVVIVSQQTADDMSLGLNVTGAMRCDVIVKRSDYPGTPSLGGSIVVTFQNGATKTLRVSESELDGRAFRHVDPSGEYLRVHTVTTGSTDVTTTTSQTTTTTAGA